MSIVLDEKKTTSTIAAASDAPLRIAIVGCGAVTEKKHLPALAGSTSLKVTALVDLDEARAKRVASAFGVDKVFTSAREAAAHADIAIVAVPHHLHAQVATELMDCGLHVFVEKPLATTMQDVETMMASAKKNGVRIGVGLVRRQYASFEYAKAVLARGWLGNITSFDMREGGVYNWPVATMATFSPATAGGVLFDTGAHTLDLVLSWLGPFRDVVYSDDARGGVDANCLLEMTLESGVRGVIELSRTRTLRNSCIIRGDNGEMEIGVGPNGPVTLRTNGVELSGAPRLPQRPDASPIDLMRIQVEEFADALRGGRDCHLFAEHTIETVRLFDACKRQPRSLELPWEAFLAASSLPDLTGKTALVLGGTGFIGGRLVETLVRHTGARVRVMARDFARLANVSRFAVDVVRGDITDAEALTGALAGCDLVFNCTFGRNETATLVNVDAVRTLVEKAAAARVTRVIHVSTVSAYGIPPDGDLSESDSHRPEKSFVYGYTKWQGEEAALEAAKRLGIDVRIVQPTVVYGPGAPSWTVNPLRMLKSGQVVLVNGGTGLSNPVYVDDLVLAMLRAGVAKEGGGERFLVSGQKPVTWREFYGVYEQMLGHESTISLPLEEVDRRRREMERRYTNRAQLAALLRNPVLFKQLASLPVSQRLKGMLSRPAINALKKTALGSSAVKPAAGAAPAKKPRPVHLLSELDAAFQASKVRVSVAKAERLLGYVPAHSFEQGMERTRLWAAWANLL